MIEHWMNGKEHTCVWNLVILLAEGTSRTSGTSGDELTMPELAGRKKFMMILLVLSVSCKISIQAPSSLCIHLLSSRNNSGNNEWALGAGYSVVRVWIFCFIFLRPCGLGLTCGFCAQNMKVQLFILNCIWAKCVHLVHVCVFKTSMKKRDFSVPPRNCNMGFCTVPGLEAVWDLLLVFEIRGTTSEYVDSEIIICYLKIVPVNGINCFSHFFKWRYHTLIRTTLLLIKTTSCIIYSVLLVTCIVSKKLIIDRIY